MTPITVYRSAYHEALLNAAATRAWLTKHRMAATPPATAAPRPPRGKGGWHHITPGLPTPPAALDKQLPST